MRRLVVAGDLFEAGTVERMAGHLEVVRGGMASAPEAAVGELPLLSEGEREQIGEWNGGPRPYRRERGTTPRPATSGRPGTLSVTWSCPADARALVSRRLSGDWS